ncbi:SHOCT domain-containing protein [Rhizobium sp. 2YAF20]|uniref:SHOCT domain-containing protein n=1 Tax=Rhizobium sp. 2YAF20 TaxID=3233027 RepID=UPI003F9546B3
MMTLTEEGSRVLKGIAQRYGVSQGAVEHLLMAVIAGQTTQAQFNHPDLGGMGQWSEGGMIMVGDMFNNGLKATVANLCSELASLARNANLTAPVSSHQSQYQGSGTSLFVPNAFSSGNWWPEELGYAASTGAQNDLRYAFFPASCRLAIRLGDTTTVYDTRDHQIGGFSQQQGGDQSLTFTSQYGLVRLSDLDVISPVTPKVDDHHEASASPTPPAPVPSEPQQKILGSDTPSEPQVSTEVDIFDKIERLAGLHSRGILTDQEFEAKKKELLARI